jgi:mono/diheme cytochrome c family protein
MSHFRRILLLLLPLASITMAAEKLSYNRDVRQILSDNCFACHGFDPEKREAGLRLDTREGATASNDGVVAIVPGDVNKSALWKHINSTDAEEVMPPPETHKTLSSAQKEILRQWIEQGAPYEKHWSFVPPAEETLPVVKHKDWPRQPLDHFVLAKLETKKLKPAPEAEKEILIRRVTLDLTGLPPTIAEVDAFLADAAPDAYEKAVDRLLASPHYGERMAVDWLDAARYADTNGFQVDRDREIWAWRDWVIGAFNRNLSFDQFTIEQLAGDLLPNPTLEQRIATGFNRNSMLNEEGAIDPEEFLAEYAADRAETTAGVWLALTFNCCRCHDHKYDPLTARDFYSLKAFFNNIPERGNGNYGAAIQVNSPPQIKLPAAEIEEKIVQLRKQLAQAEAAQAKEQIALLEKQIKQAELSIPTTLVMEEMKVVRPTFVLMRGAFNAPGERVEPATPAVLPAMASDLPRNRLGLAKWLVDPQNPLTARVTVNRFWQQLFGYGLVKTSEDFGSQGDSPSHPEMLDWLARDFVSNGWNVKRLMKMLVTSSTYRQHSRFTPELLELDPENRLLARGARTRLMGEFIRDQALAASGLLVKTIGGPSVKPYHPPGIYEQLTEGTGTTSYVRGKGEDLYRRSLYTYWKRSVPHPAMLTFGTPFREVCSLQRPRSNTPLQALNLMNDETYVEASRFLAARMMQSSADATARITFGFRTVLARAPKPAELAILERSYRRAFDDFSQDPVAARALLAVGATAPNPQLHAIELAALSTVASTMLCMDETVTKN